MEHCLKILPHAASPKDAIRKHLFALNLDDCVGVSLTLRQGHQGIVLDEIRAAQNVRHFLNKLNSAVYGKRFKRFGMKLNVVPVLERSTTNRIHYHLILQNPFPADSAGFYRLIEGEWAKTHFGFIQTHVHDQINHGWTDYITKTTSASDGVDWENYHWN
jgi:hypothetical protein